MAKQPKAAPDTRLLKEDPQQFPLSTANFVYMAVAAGLILLGFLLMLGSGSTADSFNPDIFSTRRIVVGPAIAFIGFVAMALAIIVRVRR